MATTTKRATNICFACDAREVRLLRAEARRRKVAVATIARLATLAYFGIKASAREVSGPRAAETAEALRYGAPRVRRVSR